MWHDRTSQMLALSHGEQLTHKRFGLWWCLHVLWLIHAYREGVLRAGGNLEQKGRIKAERVIFAFPVGVLLLKRLLVAGQPVALWMFGNQACHKRGAGEMYLWSSE